MKSIIAGMISFLCDIVWAMIESRIIQAPAFVNFCVNGIYDIVTILTGYYWLCYVEIALGAEFLKGRVLKHLAKLPVIIITVAVVASYFNGRIFYVDENNVYHRGDLVLLHVVLCHLYTIITSAHAFIKSIRCKSDFKYVEYKVLAMFLLFPLSVGIIQIFVPDIPSISVGITLAFVFVYIDLDKATIFYSNVKEYIRENFSKFISENLKTLRIPVSNVLTNKNACIFLSEIYTKESARPFLELKISNFVLSLRSNIDFMAEHICRDCFLGLGEEDSDDFRLITLYEELEVLAKYYNTDWQLKPLYYYIEQGRKVFGDYYLLYEKQASYIVSLLIPLSFSKMSSALINSAPFTPSE